MPLRGGLGACLRRADGCVRRQQQNGEGTEKGAGHRSVGVVATSKLLRRIDVLVGHLPGIGPWGDEPHVYRLGGPIIDDFALLWHIGWTHGGSPARQQEKGVRSVQETGAFSDFAGASTLLWQQWEAQESVDVQVCFTHGKNNVARVQTPIVDTTTCFANETCNH